MKTTPIKRAFLSAVLISSFTAPALAADLTVEVSDIRSAKGKIMVALHPAGEGEAFPDPKGVIAAQWSRAAPGTERFVFAGLLAGKYAVAVFHDENENGKLDANIVGMPTEGYAFSNNARGTFGPPSFADAAVTVGDAAVGTSAKLGY